MLRQLIAQAKIELQPGERLIVNPTSGTKQMSAGATLAALDEEIGEIVFTVGERADGVVKTGTERIASFSTQVFFAERALREAERLFDAGAFDGAARLLEPYDFLAEAVKARDVAACLHHWQRLDFKEARRIAAQSTASALVATRSRLDGLAKGGELNLPVLAELLHSAAELRRWGAHEDSLARSYRALELAAKIRLKQEHGIAPPYALEALCDAAPSLANKLRITADDGYCAIGLRRSFDILKALNDEFAHEYFAERRLRDLLNLRHETIAGHGTENVSPAQADEAARLLDTLLARHFPELTNERRLAGARPARLRP
jgi:CRISPR-associated protein (TIGR02710 family)